MTKLLKIDELVVGDHYYLTSTDNCYYFMEYTSGKGYSHSVGNGLISNFKKSVETRGTNQWKYKLNAIATVASMFANSTLDFIDVNRTTLVPIPPSKTKANPLHDDRMMQTLRKFNSRGNLDVRELLLMKEDMEAVHGSHVRPTPRQLQQNIILNEYETANLREKIILFDDVVTTGSHFVACRNAIHAEYPNIEICGIFIARRSLPHFDFDELF